MVILGLTGSIGMGKSYAARAFARSGVAVHGADEAVHRLVGPGGGAVALIAKAFPDVVRGRSGARFIDRAALGERVFAERDALRSLERMLHPLVARDERNFLEAVAQSGARLAVLEIPLLFETGAERRCDFTAVVSAPLHLQRVRVLRRKGMSLEKLAAIRARQMSDREKRRRADFVILSGYGWLDTLRAVRGIVRILSARRGRKWTKAPWADAQWMNALGEV